MRSSEINMLLKMGLSTAEIQKLKKSIRGKTFTVNAGITSGQSLQLSGTAKYLLGFRAFEPSAAGAMNLTIMVNQEIIWSSVNEALADCSISSVKEEYIEAFRKLNSQDVFNVEFSSVGASTCNVMVFYLN